MDQQVLQLLTTEASQFGIELKSTFPDHIDKYVEKHFSDANHSDRVVIETYLSDAALRIARAEERHLLEAEDAKAAVWIFHLPDQLNSKCIEAGMYALEAERKRKIQAPGHNVYGGVKKGMLAENFSKHLDSRDRGFSRTR